MFAKAAEILAGAGVDSPTRIDVPHKGSGSSDDGATMRDSVQAIVPALQSGSLFGGTTGVLVADAHHLLKAEVDTVAELLANADDAQAVAVFVSMGPLPAAIRDAVKASGGLETIKQFNERDAASWLGEEAKRRGLRVDQAARSELLNHFGSNTSAMARALDQLSVGGSTVSAEDVKERFTARPDEPLWLLGDAIVSGDHREALRRLSDFLQHQHPLVLLSYLEGEVKKRSLAAIAPDYDTFAEWAGANPNSYATKKVWQSKNRASTQGLASSVRALARADLTLKTQPEPTHRVTLERLTVAMCRWMG
jgi:DNA polymerase III delta subunit